MLKTEEIEKWKDALITAHANGALKPVLADGYSDLTLDDAYKVQKALASELAQSDPISGFKAALSSKAAQKARGIDTPVMGLFQSGEYRTGKILDKVVSAGVCGKLKSATVYWINQRVSGAW